VSPLDPHSPAAHEIASLWWWMLAVATIVFGGAVGLLLLAWRRRKRPGLPLLGENERANVGLVVAFGIAIPAIVLTALFVASDLYVLPKTDAPQAKTTAISVTAIGHQWFWEVRYPGTSAVTANEIHIPARTPVNLIARTADVIHSFWVPELNRKVDMIPGKTNRIELLAEEAGTYRGQCSEFCGLQHANMAFEVIAEPPARFEGWLAHMEEPAAAPATAAARRGERDFIGDGCASCHTIRGTEAKGTVGPDLTHLATRSTLAAVTIPNRHGYLNRWVRNPQSIKPGDKMPGLDLSDSQFRAIVDYLAGLR
jgi:cytochrome c oxidase subunit II